MVLPKTTGAMVTASTYVKRISPYWISGSFVAGWNLFISSSFSFWSCCCCFFIALSSLSMVKYPRPIFTHWIRMLEREKKERKKKKDGLAIKAMSSCLQTDNPLKGILMPNSRRPPAFKIPKSQRPKLAFWNHLLPKILNRLYNLSWFPFHHSTTVYWMPTTC